MYEESMKRHHKNIINSLKVTRDILCCIVFILIVSIVFRHREQNRFLSPCSDVGCPVQVLYAYDDRSEMQEMTDYIVKTFEPEGKKVVLQAFDIIKCESRWDSKAYNYNTNETGDYGLFQINSIHTKRHGTGFMHDWKENVNVAYKLYKAQGWRPWVCRRVL